ncbi:carboxylesterase family protein, partial [Actinoallomurus acaciae]
SRFAPPAAPRPWQGVRDATRIGPAAPQPPSRLEHVIGPIRLPQSEDCLSVNVWTPDVSGRRPVLVFVHGGGFTAGSGGQDGYHGHRLAEAGDLVVVTLNYRLGALGFLSLAEFGEDLGRGNFGLLDTLAALRWVREHIAAFGGDPDAVTLAGQSAGAMMTLALMSAPPAEGLFRRVILQSTPTAVAPASPGDAAAMAERYLHTLGLRPDEAHQLRTEPVERLLAAQNDLARRTARPLALAPPLHLVAEPGLVAADLITAVRDDAEIGRLVGYTRDEALAWSVPSELDDAAATELAAGFGGEQVYAEARRAMSDAAPARALAAAVTERYFARDISRLGHGGYVYRFDWHPPGSPLGACHCIELPFVFGTPPAWREAPMIAGAAPADLVHTTQAAWSSFARHGDPGSSWPVHREPGDVLRLDHPMH